jgi:transposase
MRIFAMDLGKSKTVNCLLDTVTGEREFTQAAMDPGRLGELIRSARPDQVVFEVCTDAGWVADVCRREGVAFRALNPSTLMRTMHRRRSKSDRRDALDLARVAALEPDRRGVHVPEREVRSWRALVEQRSKAVERRTERRNQIRAMFQSVGAALPSASRLWTAEGRRRLEEQASAHLGELDRARLRIAMRGHEESEREVAELEELLDAKAATDPRVGLLRTAPGVGPRLAETIVAWVDDPSRFPGAGEAGCYTGLTPRQDQSGDTDRSSRISKAGPRRLRSMLVEVAWLSLQWNPWAREVYLRALRGSPSRKKQAIAAVSRRLFVRLWAMLRDGTPWDPSHGHRLAARFGAKAA